MGPMATVRMSIHTPRKGNTIKRQNDLVGSPSDMPDSEDLDVPMDGTIEGVGSSKDGSMVQKVVDAGRHDAGADCAGENEDDEVRAVILA